MPKRQNKAVYPMGSISSGTMRHEDLIPAFCGELEWLVKHGPRQARDTRKAHTKLVRDIQTAMETNDNNADREPYFDSADAQSDLESLFDALECYAGPYFHFGAHPGDGSDYGFWLDEYWDEDFVTKKPGYVLDNLRILPETTSIKVNDLAEVPNWFRGEVAVVSDHGNVTLYVKTARKLTEIWSVV